MTPPDRELVDAACRGDINSFSELYRRYYRMAVGVTRSRLSDLHLAEDAAQESFAIACRSLRTLRDGNQFAPWLGTICRRTATRFAKAEREYEPLHTENGPTTDAAAASLRNDVRDALEQLDETAREIVLLHYFSGLSYEEIACVVNLSSQSIHGRLQRARRRLAELLEPTGANQ